MVDGLVTGWDVWIFRGEGVVVKGANGVCAGLMAWIVEKFRTWSDCGGDVESRFSKDELLTNISLYWFNANITSSARLYYETMGPFAKNTFHRGRVRVTPCTPVPST